MAYRLVYFYLSYSKVDVALNPQAVVEVDKAKSVNQAVQRLLHNEPLQYVLGEADFYDLVFAVNPNVLIPRPETEELVQLILSHHLDKKFSILDIGTGSGCIPISLKKHLPKAHVSGCDISREALALAKANAQRNGVEVNFFYCDILNKNHWSENHYDVVVSNPPYVLNADKKTMRPNVLDFEPHLALFVADDDPLVFYKVIADFALQALNASGHLYFEIHEAYGAATQELLETKGFKNVIVHQDVFGKVRMISASL